LLESTKATLTIEYVSIADLRPASRNARTHSAAQIQQIARSIEQFGWTNPILIAPDRSIIAGHGRLEAAKLRGLANVPTITLAGLTPAQRRALVIADNQLALNAGWDEETLRLELGELGAEGFDVSLIGFSDEELAAILADRTEGLTDPDDAPELPAEPCTQLGDVWLLGRHRLLCGSSMAEEPVVKVMAGQLADVVFTDPPYGVAYLGSAASGSIAGDITQAAIPVAFKQAIDHATKDDARLYFCGGSSNVQMYYALFDAYLHSAPSLIIWDKGQIVLRRNNYHSQYEVVFFGWKGVGGGPKNWFGPRTADAASDIWAVKRDNGADYLHPTQKPTALAERAINNSCPPGGVVYEPFSGSGSTIIAAEMTGRACHAIELSPAYVDVAVLRWQSFTGQLATHATDGRSFADIAAERVPQPVAA
jgi:hypothetical protein